ncbi:MAG TPA: alpha/beta fold hydrolase [Salinimicrobium sp.]|nr:alpha/beta fold hydrolase [Salinimicrobium sp.]
MDNSKSSGVAEIINRHEASGRYFDVKGVKTFALDYGKGEAVLCLHGVPTSSFLYRKVLAGLKKKGYRGISIDLPGLGLSGRPQNFNYSFQGYVEFLGEAVRVLGLKKFHLVVHDIGGPIGFALAAGIRKKISSITILNTWIDVVNFEKPLVMRPFEKRGIGQAELRMITHLTWPVMFNKIGILRDGIVPRAEINAYVDLLKREDNGAAFLKIMRNFDSSPEFRDLCYAAVHDVPYPVQAIWGGKDITLTYDRYAREIMDVASLEKISVLPSRHFLQEEVWLGIADYIDEIIKTAHTR